MRIFGIGTDIVKISRIKKAGEWKKNEIVDLFNETIPNFNHTETGRSLDSKM